MNIGFIGIGNMGGAIINSLLNVDNVNLHVFDVDNNKLTKFKDTKISVCQTIKDIADASDIIFLTVKPNVYSDVLKQLDAAKFNKVLVSVAPGISVSYIKSVINAEIIRIMPNTPAMVGEGMTLVAETSCLKLNNVLDILKHVGKTTLIPEKLMDAGTALSGSSPAMVYQLIDALANAALSYGISKKDAVEIAAQTVLGSAKMVLETKEHPQELSDKVCSPGGTTIEMVNTLKKCGFDATVVKAFDACVNKAKQMNK